MRCVICDFDNPEGMNFCGKCAAPLASCCRQCGFENPLGFAFCGKCATPLSGKAKVKRQRAKVKNSQPPSPNPQPLAERRQLTVMFCDLVGSTALSEQLDPEELREVIHIYQQTSAEIIEGYDGHIAQYLGDGLLVYFGYPAAHEDDAVRAVRAGVEIVGAIHELPLQHPLQVRIGIHTGLVVVGEVGGGAKREQLALGETPNIAARVQGQAAPNTVVVSAATLRLLHGLFAAEDLGQQALKGIATPMALYRVRGENIAQRRFEATLHPGRLPLIGRELELEMLRDRWRRVVQGAGQVVLLSGEPGIGKSRLVQTLRELTLRDGATQVELHCSPYHQNSAYYPIIEHLQRFLRFTLHDTPQTKLDKLTEALASYRFPQAETLSLLAAFLSLPHPEGSPPLTLSPQKQKEKTQEAIIAWIVEEAERAPVYCAWEDLHWVDPSTLDLLTLLLAQVPTARLLMLLTFRPEFTLPWGPRSYLSQLTLSRLGQSHVEAMIGTVTGGNALAPEILQQIVAKTDGVPLFVEELTKSVTETLEATGRSPLQFGIPTTLQDALMARLDRLGPAKEIAQVGATIGREFTYDVLHAVSPLTVDTLQRGLRQLVDAELLYQHGVPPQATYLFKHALVQDTAYQSLLKSTRQQLHQQIAQVLEARFGEIKETQPELLAHHCTEAGLIEQAVPYWQQAGQKAMQCSANTEAINYLDKGLELLKMLPDTAARARQELTLRLALGASMTAARGAADPEAETLYLRMRELCRQLGETPEIFPALWGLRAFYTVRGELETALGIGEQLFRLAQNVQEPALLLEAHLGLGITLGWRGELAAARGHLEQAISLYDPQQHRSLAFLHGYDPGALSHGFAALSLWVLGYPDQARRRINEALVRAQEANHPFSLCYVSLQAAVVHLRCREVHIAQQWIEEASALASKHGFRHLLAGGNMAQGWVWAEQNKGAESIPQMRQGIAALRATGAGVEIVGALCFLAKAYRKIGRTEEGLTTLSEALTMVQAAGGCHIEEAEVYQLKGELLLAQAEKSQKANGKSLS